MFREPWYTVDPEEALRLEQELDRELPVGHILSGKGVVAIAMRKDQDDVLYQLVGPDSVAVVHLTYSQETMPAFPKTEIFPTLERFFSERMAIDCLEWE